jgi:hypothetical protein
MKSLILTLALIAGTAHADYSIQIHGKSWHDAPRSEYDNTGKQWNERNFGAALRYAFDRNTAVQAGIYRNSEGKTSAYMGADWTPLHIGSFSAGLFGGAVTGYTAYAVAPIAGLVARQQLGRFSVTARMTPPIRKIAPTMIAIEFGIDL